MTLPNGSRLGPYEIVAHLGTGGMGEVYRARDSRLGREVAVKILPGTFAADADRIRRFEQEARATGMLDHQNILAVHDVGTTDSGTPYLVTELLEGETLRAAMVSGPLGVQRALRYATQILHGLAAAAEKGIVHRDLKPENLFLTRNGVVKILDFGLAKLTRDGDGEGGPRTDLPTATRGTEPGLVLGTVGYMSPEQVRGQPADARSDIFAFGAILYEMLSGRRPFQGASAADTISAILREEPPELSTPRQIVPAGVDSVVRHCLEKDPEHRFHSALDVAFALESVSTKASTPGAPAAKPGVRIGRRRNLWLGVGIVAAVAAAAFLFRSDFMRGRPIDSIAVLPFASSPPQKGADTDYLSDGLTDNVTNRLSQIPHLRVIARTVVARYKGAADPQAVGRTLNVKAVLSGKVVSRGNGLVIQADLLDVRDGTQLWGESYNLPVSDLESTERDITGRISEALKVRLDGDQKKRLVKANTENSEAYQLYLKGRYAWEKREDASLLKSIEYFDAAVEKDPGYALAYAGLANSYAVLSVNGLRRPADSFPQAISAARRALEIDPRLAPPHTALGWAFCSYEWNYGAAEVEFRRAIELDPGYATAHHWYGLLLAALGRKNESIWQLEQATRLDPFSLVMRTNTVRVLIYARQFDRAVAVGEATLQAFPNSVLAPLWLGRAYEARGMLDRAAVEEEKARSWGSLARVLARSGLKDKAQAALARMQDEARQGYVEPFAFALTYEAFGDRDRAFEWFDKAVEDRSATLMFLNVIPELDPIRADPRFAALLRRVHLAG